MRWEKCLRQLEVEVLPPFLVSILLGDPSVLEGFLHLWCRQVCCSVTPRFVDIGG
jgi:hypothetical protein